MRKQLIPGREFVRGHVMFVRPDSKRDESPFKLGDWPSPAGLLPLSTGQPRVQVSKTRSPLGTLLRRVLPLGKSHETRVSR